MKLSDLPDLECRGVVLHWSAGRYTTWFPHYSVCVLGPPRDGEIILSHPFKNNLRKIQPGMEYAAHTRGRNSYRLAISAMSMYGATTNDYGFFSPTRKQIETMCALAGLMVVKYAVMRNLRALTPAVIEEFVKTHYEYAVLDRYFPNRWDWMAETPELKRKVFWYAKKIA